MSVHYPKLCVETWNEEVELQGTNGTPYTDTTKHICAMGEHDKSDEHICSCGGTKEADEPIPDTPMIDALLADYRAGWV